MPEDKPFLNEDRKRYYGLRIGDVIDVYSISGRKWGRSEVLDFTMDNNKVIIKSSIGKPIEWTAEYCEIVIKVEDVSIKIN